MIPALDCTKNKMTLLTVHITILLVGFEPESI